jgi:hypothetical protein
MYVDERVVEKSAYYSNYAETLVEKFITMWLNIKSTIKTVPNP